MRLACGWVATDPTKPCAMANFRESYGTRLNSYNQVPFVTNFKRKTASICTNADDAAIHRDKIRQHGFFIVLSYGRFL